MEGDNVMESKRMQEFKDIMIRTGKTFIEAFLCYLTIDGLFAVTSYTALKKVLLSLLVGAAAAGFTAVWNMLIQWLTVRIDELGEDEPTAEEQIEAEISDLLGGDNNGKNE